MRKELKLKLDEACFLLDNGDKFGKHIFKWNVPVDLVKINKNYRYGGIDAWKYREIFGIGQWQNKPEIFVALSMGNELIYVSKENWLKIGEMLKKIK